MTRQEKQKLGNKAASMRCHGGLSAPAIANKMKQELNDARVPEADHLKVVEKFLHRAKI